MLSNLYRIFDRQLEKVRTNFEFYSYSVYTLLIVLLKWGQKEHGDDYINFPKIKFCYAHFSLLKIRACFILSEWADFCQSIFISFGSQLCFVGKPLLPHVQIPHQLHQLMDPINIKLDHKYNLVYHRHSENKIIEIKPNPTTITLNKKPNIKL